MPLRTFCDNKGCRKEMAPVIDKATEIVYCTECGEPINTLTPFARRQLVSLGQVKKNEKRTQAWSVKCHECEKEGPPELDKAGDTLVCSYCKHELDKLSKPYAQVVKQNLQAQRRAEQHQ